MEQTVQQKEQIATVLGNLYGRWQDEREYEDFADYKRAMEKTLNGMGYTLVKMTKSPFAKLA